MILPTNSATEGDSSPQTEVRADSIDNHEYNRLPKFIRARLSVEQWLWHPNKHNLLDEYVYPEVAEDG